MKFNLNSLLLCILFSVSANAADFAKCKQAGTQLELDACAVDDFDAADRELNEVYKALSTKESKNISFINKLRNAQNAWIKFRDAELDAMYACEDENSRVCWGSMLPMCYSSYKAKLTRERTKRLREFLEDGQPADACH